MGMETSVTIQYVMETQESVPVVQDTQKDLIVITVSLDTMVQLPMETVQNVTVTNMDLYNYCVTRTLASVNVEMDMWAEIVDSVRLAMGTLLKAVRCATAVLMALSVKTVIL